MVDKLCIYCNNLVTEARADLGYKTQYYCNECEKFVDIYEQDTPEQNSVDTTALDVEPSVSVGNSIASADDLDAEIKPESFQEEQTEVEESV